MSVEFGREIGRNAGYGEKLEWLCTNGIGGYASGTVTGTLTRRYHGFLVAALKPPLGRTVLATKLDETAHYDDREFDLSSNRWADGSMSPAGFENIERFYLDGTMPVWEFSVSDAVLEKRIWMKQGENTTYARYTLKRSSLPLELEVKAYVNYRDYHSLTRGSGWQMGVKDCGHGVMINAFDGATPYYIISDGAEAETVNAWYYGFKLTEEEYRGLDNVEDHLHAVTFRRKLMPGEFVTIAASLNEKAYEKTDKEHDKRKKYELELLGRLPESEAAGSAINQLVLAADQFIVDRKPEGESEGKSVIAGYHWFGDWGRDTMISLPGLTISTGRKEVAASILGTFSRYVDMGMLPNRFPDAGEEPEYNTVDATLWYFEAVRQYYEVSKDRAFLKEIFPVLHSIVQWHLNGTRYGIKADPSDGLLYAGEEGVQLTWMDAKVGDWVVTPRIGKPVEVNALWYNALVSMSEFARYLKMPQGKYNELAEKARAGFSKYWHGELKYCYDVIDSPGGNDLCLRPNQIIAVSLKHSALTEDQQKGVVDACARDLLTSSGLRSLAQGYAGYTPHYGGDQRSRDGAYHQGTVWGWLLGPFALAHHRVYKDPALALSYLEPLVRQINCHGLGTLSEIFDADPPFTPRGCIAQAWTVAETLRAWTELHKSIAE